MDILEANFPQLLPKKHTVQQMRDAESLPIAGRRGVASDETSIASGVIQCDEVFLDSLMDHLRLTELAIYIADDSKKVAKHYVAMNRTTNPLDSDETVHLREAVTIISKVVPEVQRLSSHPELFASEARKADFLGEAGRLAMFCNEFLNIMDEEENLMLSLEDELEEAASRRPLEAETGNRLQPYETFTTAIDTKKLAHQPFFEPIQDQVPGLHLQKAHALPPSALLIAQHHNAKQDWFYSTATDVPADLLALQHSTNELVRDVGRKGDGSAVVKTLLPIPPSSDQRQDIAYGKQERVAEMSRLMALLDGDITSVGMLPPTTFLSTFLSEEGMESLNNQLNAVGEELGDTK